MDNSDNKNRGIIINLHRRTTNDELKWYVAVDNDYVTKFVCSEKLTNKKAISYNIFYKKKYNDTHMIIFLDYRKFDKGISSPHSIDSKKIQTIRSNGVILLLRNVLTKLGNVVHNKTHILIRNKYNKNYFYLITKGGKYVFPSFVGDNIKFNINRLGFSPMTYKKCDEFKNIMKTGKNEYVINNLYLVTDYKENDNSKGHHFQWIPIDDIFNYFIDDDTKLITKFYLDNKSNSELDYWKDKMSREELIGN